MEKMLGYGSQKIDQPGIIRRNPENCLKIPLSDSKKYLIC